jgi:hypothetical protein
VPEVTYTYSLSGDFGGDINISTLFDEIQASAIVNTCYGVSLLGDTVTIGFEGSLSGGDETILDGLVSSHDSTTPIFIEEDPQLSAFTVYDNTGGQAFTGTITVNLDTVKTNTEPTVFSLSADVVTIALEGTYFVSYEGSVDTSGGRTESRWFLQRDSGSGFSTEDGTFSWGYHRNGSQGITTASCTVVLSVAAGDQFRLRAQRNTGGSTLTTQADGSRLTFIRLGN